MFFKGGDIEVECKDAWEVIALEGIDDLLSVSAKLEKWSVSGGGENGVAAAFKHIQKCSDPICKEIRQRMEEIHHLLGPVRAKYKSFRNRFQISRTGWFGRIEFELKINLAKKEHRLPQNGLKSLKEIITCSL